MWESLLPLSDCSICTHTCLSGAPSFLSLQCRVLCMVVHMMQLSPTVLFCAFAVQKLAGGSRRTPKESSQPRFSVRSYGWQGSTTGSAACGGVGGGLGDWLWISRNANCANSSSIGDSPANISALLPPHSFELHALCQATYSVQSVISKCPGECSCGLAAGIL